MVQVDRHARHAQRDPEFIPRTAYGRVLKYFEHEWRGETRAMAYVQYFQDLYTDTDYGFTFCRGRLAFSPPVMIETSCIKAMVGTVYNSKVKGTYIVEQDFVVNVPRRVPHM